MQLSLPLDQAASLVVFSVPPAGAGSAPDAPPGLAPGTLRDTPRDEPTWTVTFVRRSRARRYVLRVDFDGHVRVTIPRGGSRKDAESFVRRQRAWIEQQRSTHRPPVTPPAARQAFREQAAHELPARLRALAARHGLDVQRVSVRNQRTRWGSCGRNGHITLNWRLVMMPEWVTDYVLVHELMHLKRLDHSPEYWKLVADACPRFREARQWLRAHAERLR